jgi:hypothetical protein
VLRDAAYFVGMSASGGMPVIAFVGRPFIRKGMHMPERNFAIAGRQTQDSGDTAHKADKIPEYLLFHKNLPCRLCVFYDGFRKAAFVAQTEPVMYIFLLYIV